MSEYDLLVNALVGFVGFLPTLTAIQTGHNIALANKETLVVGGELIEKAIKEYGVSLYPIDKLSRFDRCQCRGYEFEFIGYRDTTTLGTIIYSKNTHF